jgi:hypothetical protein
MLVFIISLVCIYLTCAAFFLIGIWKAPHGFEDENGFHRSAAPRSEKWREESGEPAMESKEAPGNS